MRKLTSLLLVLLLSAGSYAAPEKNKPMPWPESVAAYKAKATKGLKATAESPVMKARQDAQKLTVDVTGAENLMLVTSATPDGNSNDHAVWANGRLIAKDGSSVWINDLKPVYQKSGWDGLEVLYDRNVGGKPVEINGQKFDHTILIHATGYLVLPLNKKYVRFETEVGLDNGASPAGSVLFRAQPMSDFSTIDQIKQQNQQQMSAFARYAGEPLVWLMSTDNSTEKQALAQAVRELEKGDYFKSELDRIGAIADVVQQETELLRLFCRIQGVQSVERDVKWLNVKAVETAFADMKKNPKFDLALYQPKLDELKALAAPGFEAIYTADNEAAIARAKQAVALKKEILLANPLLDVDRLIVGRYKLNDQARTAMAPELGTQPNNWSNQTSASRRGFDAEIAELSNLRGEIKTRTIYKPDNGSSVPDLTLHWDADRILFTMSDANRHWQVYEVGVDGKGLKLVTNSPEKDLEFFDATYLPNGKMLVINNIGYNGVPCVHGSDEVGNMCLFDPKTGEMRRLTFDQDANWGPVMMNNGRVMYTRWEYTDLTHYFSRFVMHMNPDGTEQKALFGSGAYFPNSTFDIKPLPGHASKFVGIISGHHGIARSGRLMLFDPSIDRKSVAAMQEIPFSKREIIPLVKDEMVNGVWPQFVKPYPLNDTYFLVSGKLDPNDLWRIYLVDVYDNVTPLASFEGEGLIQAIPLEKKPVPPVIPDKIKPGSKEATVFIQDIYEGEGLQDVPRGEVKALRVFAYEYAYVRSPSDHYAQGIQSGWDIKRLLGTVPVEEDGSVMFTIPANTPISLQPLDKDGAAIQWMRSWLTGMPGETVSCIGCHENQNQIPMPKKVVASAKAPQTITAPEGGVRSFTFELEVQPILDRACVACHNGKSPKADFTGGRMDKALGFSESYLSLHPFVHRQGPEAEIEVMNPYEYHVSTSPLIRILKNDHYGVKLTDKEWQSLYNWIDFNAPYKGTFVAVPQNGIEQIKRRQELNDKYATGGVDWQGEIKAYADYLAKQPKAEPVMPEKKKEVKVKEVKLKSWPFDATQATALQSAAGETRKEVELAPGVKMVFVRIPAGEFAMGSNSPASDYSPARKVKINKPFWMAEIEVSNQQMHALFPDHNSRLIHQQWKDHVNGGYVAWRDEQPAIRVTWEKAMDYCRKLSEKTGLKVTLPTEEQWEWACRAGSGDAFWYGNLNDSFAACENMADSQLTKLAVSGVDPQPMGSNSFWFKYYSWHPKEMGVDDGSMLTVQGAKYKANPWGLYDMHGNVEEWTRSDYLPYGENPKKAEPTGQKVVRGGSWIDHPKTATAYFRRAYLPWQTVYNVGFRVIIEED